MLELVAKGTISLAVLTSSLSVSSVEYTVINQIPQRITAEMRSMTSSDIESLIREVWGEDAEKGIAVARCESTLRQFKADGTILRGIVNPDDIGIFQINSYYHEEDYLRFGFDVFTPRGNVEYAKYIYDRSGLAPWVHSKPCWSKSLASP